MISERWPIVSDDARIQDHYEAMREAGESHNLAELLALQQCPQVVTDSTFMVGSENGKQFERNPVIGDRYRKIAEAKGGSTTGKKYLSQLAEFPGDPRAWVSTRGEVKKLCEQNGWGVDGAVKVKVRDCKPTPPVGVAEDLVQDEVASICAQLPDGDRVDRADLADQVREKRKPHWAK